MRINREYLKKNRNHIFVFGDNSIRRGNAGAAELRDEPNTFGFITKKFPDNNKTSFYTPEEYKPIFEKELEKLEMHIKLSPNCLWLISQIGSGLANKYNIWEKVIQKEIFKLPDRYNNVKLLF